MSNVLHFPHTTDTKAFVSAPNPNLTIADLDQLQAGFGGRLSIGRGAHGEAIIVAQPQDMPRLGAIINACGSGFTERTVAL